MSGCEELTGYPTTDRALVILARLLGEIAATASSADIQIDGWISPTRLAAQTLATKASGEQAVMRIHASRRPRRASARRRPQPNRNLNVLWEGDK
jgi:hypothetical protein